jgi:hypothetical protein
MFHGSVVGEDAIIEPSGSEPRESSRVEKLSRRNINDSEAKGTMSKVDEVHIR